MTIGEEDAFFPANAEVINVTGEILYPGLLDVHVHSISWKRRKKQRDQI